MVFRRLRFRSVEGGRQDDFHPNNDVTMEVVHSLNDGKVSLVYLWIHPFFGYTAGSTNIAGWKMDPN